jgi:hypothetical protein
VAHCPPGLLHDVADVLADVRTWTGVVEKKPGVFYVRGLPFLHFHLAANGRRRADVKGSAGWMQLDLPRPITPARRRALSRELRMRHAETVGTRSGATRAAARPATSRRGSRISQGRRRGSSPAHA